MDTTASNIIFDDSGFCNFCNKFLGKLNVLNKLVSQQESSKNNFIQTIKENGAGKEYDCVVGVSGGLDSSYALYIAVKEGLRPLAVHLDNGWNSELASHNMANLISNLGVDLYTHVIDWKENRDLQRSFFKANVVDIEMLMDNAMLALNYQIAAKQGIKYILAGTNLSTEGMDMPKNWNHLKYDAKNIKDIHKKFGSLPIKTHPLISSVSFVWYEFARKIKWVPFLDYFNYTKANALKILQEECDYKPYPYKHFESVFTRFYQAYILPRKFSIDKRRLHFSTLIISGQMTRDEALKELEKSTYPDPEQEMNDFKFVIKKLGFSEEEFFSYINAPPCPHSLFKSEEKLWIKLKSVYETIRKYV